MDKQRAKNHINVFIALSSLALIVLFIFEVSKRSLLPEAEFIKTLDLIILTIFFFELSIKILLKNSFSAALRENSFALLVFFSYFALSNWVPAKPITLLTKTFSKEDIFRILLLARLAILIVKLLSTLISVRDFFTNLSLNPAKSIVFGFTVIIFIGAIFLTLPISLQEGKTLSFVDALFTSTSAVCVTGLIVVDTGSHFSTFGQVILLLLIQVGGLGFMTLAVFIGLFLKEQLSIRERQTTQSLLDQTNATSIFELIKKIIGITLFIELLGTIAIYIFHTINPLPANCGTDSLFFYSLFHAVSAFCNAGFALNPDSLVYLYGSFIGNLIFIFLIIAGGIGFTVILNLKHRFFSIRKKHFLYGKSKQPKERLSLHTRIVLVMTAILILGGAIFFFLTENSNTLANMNPLEKVYTSFFQSTTTRTAGFNSIDFTQLRPVTLLLMIGLMVIGASPGSTGGGLKTTTYAVLMLTITSMFRKKEEVEIGKKVLPRDIINKALSITVLFISMIFIASFIIIFFESSFSFIQILFEVVSATATVGLSTGITAKLSTISKFVIIVSMFFGRIGPMTLLMSMSSGKGRKKLVQYPEEKIMVG